MKKQKKALFCAFAAAVSLAAAIPAVSYAAEADVRTASTETVLPGELEDNNAFGWVKDKKGSLFYRDDSGELLTGEQEIDGELYLFAKNGVLKTGWRTVGGVRRYYHINDGTADHGKPVYGWVTDSGKRFYVSKENGKLSGCTVEDGGKLYYLLEKGDAADEEMFINAGDKQYYVTADGTLATGSLEIDGIPYTFGDDGVIQTGWVSAGDKAYYFSPEDGSAQIGWLALEDGKYYVTKENGKTTGIFAIEGVAYDFGEDGRVKSGWVEYNGTKRYFNEDGTFKTGLCNIDGVDYVFAESGLLAKGLVVTGGRIYFTDADGKPQKGRIKIGDDAYLFGEDYFALTGIVSIDDDRYLFGTDGIMLKGLAEYQGKTYYLGDDGKMLTGRIRIGSDKYYFDENGAMSTGLLTIDGNKYFFGDDGKMVTGFQEIDGKTYFFDTENGAMSIGRIRVGSDKYYFNEDGSMFTGLAELSDGKYFFGEDGKMTTGWQEIDGKKYYFDPTTGMMVTNVKEPSNLPAVDTNVTAKRLNVANILQNPELPTGCESVSLTILLNHLGFSVNKMTIARQYLPKLDFYTKNGVYYGADFRTTFAGNPESSNSYGCYAPCITTTANRYFSANGFKSTACNITGAEFDSLLNDYINNDIPVLIWITSNNLHETRLTSVWTTPSGERVQWLAYEHCVVLTGYDKANNLVYVSDPLVGNTSYDYSRLKQRYIDMGKQAVYIQYKDLFLNNKLLISGTKWELPADKSPVEKAIMFNKDGVSGYYVIYSENKTESFGIPFRYETKGDEITLYIEDSANTVITTKLVGSDSGYTLPLKWQNGNTENFSVIF